MFYFEQLLLTALSGIDSYNITSTVLGVAGTILLLSFLYSAYQAFAMGGDVRPSSRPRRVSKRGGLYPLATHDGLFCPRFGFRSSWRSGDG